MIYNKQKAFNIILVIINTILWYGVINPTYISYKILTVAALYTIGNYLVGSKYDLNNIKNLAIVFIAFDILSLWLGKYSILLVVGIIIYLVYKVTTNPQMVQARKNLRNALDEVRR